MRRVRIGNDFVYLMPVVRDGEVEDLTVARNLKLMCNAGGSSSEIPFELIGTHTLRIEVTTEIANRLGLYNFEVSYELEDLSLADKSLEVTQDKDVFWIVAKTAQADEVTELTGVIDVSIGLCGKAFEYKDFTEEQLQDLKQPAIEAGIIARQQGDYAKQQAIRAESATTNIEDSFDEWEAQEASRVQSESFRVDNEESRIDAEDLRVLNEYERQQAELIRIENDKQRIVSISGSQEFNEINIL